MASPQIFWIDPNKFDQCQHRMVSIAMMEHLRQTPLAITYVTSYRDRPIPYPHFHYVDTFTKIPGLYRLAFLVAVLGFLHGQVRRGGRMVLIVFPQAFYIALLAKILGWFRGFRVDIHLDVRTPPLATGKNRFVHAIKFALEYVVFWRLVIFLSRPFATTYSFITDRMRQDVGAGRKPWCLWSSGVREELLAQSLPAAAVSPLEENAARTPRLRPFELLYLGSLREGVEKAVAAVIEEGPRLGNLVFRLVGDGPMGETIRRMIREAGVEGRVVMEGMVKPEEVPGYLARAHAFISPLPDNPTWRVSSPIKLFEYLATGKPVILTETAPHRDVLPGETPGVVWIRDLSTPAIAAAIRELMANYDPYLAAYEQRVSIVRGYTWGAQAGRLSDFLIKHYCQD